MSKSLRKCKPPKEANRLVQNEFGQLWDSLTFGLELRGLAKCQSKKKLPCMEQIHGFGASILFHLIYMRMLQHSKSSFGKSANAK